jgi:heterodisulfide reductase subunit C
MPLAQPDVAFLHEVERKTDYRLSLCYQCGKCSAGCPIAFEMDYPPHQIIRGVQLGLRDLVLSSRTIWLCAACQTCSTRCPQGVDPAEVMDVLRRMAYAEGIWSPAHDVPLFHRLFMRSVRRFGRAFETGIAALYNLSSGHYAKDLVMALRILIQGKLVVLPPIDGQAEDIKEMYARATALETEKDEISV